VVSEIVITGRRHAAALVPAVHEVLRFAGLGYGGLQGIVVADGPGSFTGLRIGFATALGILAERDELDLYTAPSLLATALGARAFCGGAVAALYDALRGEVFGAVYEVAGHRVEVLLPPTRATVEDLMARCPRAPVLAVGDGAARYGDSVRAWTGRDPVGPPVGSPRASLLLSALALEHGATKVEDPVSFEPAYGRLAEAQVRWEREHGRPLPHPSGETD
jgi:tRNA threonylcarbamoyladenosine biosynthesis protein TsaB